MKMDLPAGQLYNLTTDSGEQKNVYREFTEVVGRLRTLLGQYVARGRSSPGKPQQNDGEVNIFGKREGE